MVNIIWAAMLLTGIMVAAVNGNIEAVTTAALKGAQWAVDFALGLIAIMTFWLGIMKVAEEAGMVRILGTIVEPVTRFLFPTVPRDHPAMGAIIMNLSANVLGLGNAATPMGLIAMKELQKLNKSEPESASEAMCTFLALNTSCITLIPATIIGIRIQAGSLNPTEIVGTTIFATSCAMFVAIVVDRILRALYRRRTWR
ncbi:nucleoside recognition domain-containing protein [Phosphitispora fastidiosa]|uniref:nucleoside recognition domain-containing protein n=1 Tax=Phosphitispora fastidiosa TaxID=2837202 RepID=UPI001E3E4F33|nr:nucleoside recognition domain-containing protein [Phosphitispora fastidiosa]MBU7005307.1 spore maturation protein A [Phosphitispora fastidiosa]